MDLNQQKCAHHTEDINRQADPKELLQVFWLVINDTCGVVIDCSNQFDHEEDHAEGDWELLWAEPHAHYCLLDDGLRVTDAENKSWNEAVRIALLLKSDYKDILPHHST